MLLLVATPLLDAAPASMVLKANAEYLYLKTKLSFFSRWLLKLRGMHWDLILAWRHSLDSGYCKVIIQKYCTFLIEHYFQDGA
jgi:hypothetical protein